MLSIVMGEGSEMLAPLARVVFGGLLTSTMITLVFVPAMYTLFEEGWSGMFKKGHGTPAAPAAEAH
jgi:HAE1 family hydrophobic/amphiphilic exporter-1